MREELSQFKITNHVPLGQCRVELVTTENCTFRCSYCYWKNDERYSFEAKNLIDIERFHRVIDFMLAQDKGSYSIDFYGGEPTSHPFFLDFIEIAAQRVPGINIGMLSNLSKPHHYFEKLAKKNLVSSIIASMHTEFVKNIDSWFEKVRLLNPEEIRLVLKDDNKDIIFETYKKYEKEFGENLLIHPIDTYSDLENLLKIKDMRVQIDDDSHSHADDVEVYLKDGSRYQGDYRRLSNFKGMLCNAGYHIDMKGNVYSCWSAYSEENKLLNVFNDTPKKLSGWTLCNYDLCACGQRYTKYSKETYLEKRKLGQL